MLELENIKKTYGAQQVLDIPSWKVERGEAVVLLGPNAAGKTTLLEIIAGLAPPTDGRVLLDGKQVNGPNRNIGIVLQDPVMFSTTVAGNISLAIPGNGDDKKAKAERINRALSMVGLEHVANKGANQLSVGQKHRLAIARTLVLEPELLLLDEPLANLDQHSALHVASILKSLNENEGQTIVIATHNLHFASRIAKRTDILRNGCPVPYTTGNLYSGKNADIDGEFLVELGGGILVSTGSKQAGDVDLVIPPEQIVLSREPLTSSMRNNFKGRLTQLTEQNGRVLALVDIGIPIEAAVTPAALTDLGVTIGDDIYVSFKAHGVLVFPKEVGVSQ